MRSPGACPQCWWAASGHGRAYADGPVSAAQVSGGKAAGAGRCSAPLLPGLRASLTSTVAGGQICAPQPSEFQLGQGEILAPVLAASEPGLGLGSKSQAKPAGGGLCWACRRRLGLGAHGGAVLVAAEGDGLHLLAKGEARAIVRLTRSLGRRRLLLAELLSLLPHALLHVVEEVLLGADDGSRAAEAKIADGLGGVKAEMLHDIEADEGTRAAKTSLAVDSESARLLRHVGGW